ncbi:MAG: hypothetical protein RIR51_1348 [Bacteroidota bacterium]|jgi:ligand-binding SRPBCC domain-containing protein
MKFIVKTLVNNKLEYIIPKFNQDLFIKLSPPFPPAKLNRFDGCKLGDKYSIELNFGIKLNWEGTITREENSENYYLFVDEGTRLPFGLKKWKHQHWMIRKGENITEIKDEIEYRAGNRILDLLLFLGLYGLIIYRKPLYKKYLA